MNCIIMFRYKRDLECVATKLLLRVAIRKDCNSLVVAHDDIFLSEIEASQRMTLLRNPFFSHSVSSSSSKSIHFLNAIIDLFVLNGIFVEDLK